MSIETKEKIKLSWEKDSGNVVVEKTIEEINGERDCPLYEIIYDGTSLYVQGDIHLDQMISLLQEARIKEVIVK